MSSAGIYKKWHDVTIESFTNCEEAKSKASKYLTDFTVGETIFGLNITGVPGSGKSHLLNFMAVSLFLRGVKVHVVPLNHLMTLYTGSFNSYEDRQSLSHIVKAPDHLFVEDLGREFKSDLATKVISIVLRHRINIRKPVTVATSLLPKEIIDQYGEEVSSLMKEICIPIRITGKDFRSKIFEQNREKLQ